MAQGGHDSTNENVFEEEEEEDDDDDDDDHSLLRGSVSRIRVCTVRADMWVRGSCFSTCARPRVTLPYIHSLLDIPPTLSSYIVHIRIFIYIYKRRQLNFSCAYTWPHADSYAARDACPRVSLSLSMLLRIGCNIRVRSNVCAWCAHVCMNVRVYMCVCEVGYDARRRQSAFGRKQVPACRVPKSEAKRS